MKRELEELHVYKVHIAANSGWYIEVVGHVSSTVAVWVPSHIQKLYIVQ